LLLCTTWINFQTHHMQTPKASLACCSMCFKLASVRLPLSLSAAWSLLQVLLVTNFVLIKRLGRAYKAAAQQMQQHLTAMPVTGYPQGGVQMGAMGGPPAGYPPQSTPPQHWGAQPAGGASYPPQSTPPQNWGAQPAGGAGGAAPYPSAGAASQTTTPPAGYPSQFTPPAATGTNAA
jgi:hypothetical protein